MKISYNYPSQREFDFYLMDNIHEITLSTIKSENINACRLHLKLMIFSDIKIKQGNRLIKGIFHGDKTYLRTSTLQWPNQPSSNKKTWLLWSRTISQIYYTKYKSDILR